jgi:Kelch motif
MKENRGSHGAAGVGECLYVLGGGGFHSNLATCEMLDTRSNEWRAIAPMKTFRHALAVVSLETTREFFTTQQKVVPFTEKHGSLKELEKLGLPEGVVPLVFVIGGWIDGTVCSADVEVYDVMTDSWHSAAPLTVPRRLHGATALDNKIYVFGGNCDDGVWYTAAVECYDLSTNSWTKRKDLPQPGPTSAVAVGQYIYVLMHGKRIVRYDPRTDDYMNLAELPLKEWFTFDVTTSGSVIYVHGGATMGVWSKAFYSYDVLTNEWTELPQMIRQRRRCAAAIVTVK